ncbi:MAG: hypothetical protein V7731_12305 [Amphritea sp.]
MLEERIERDFFERSEEEQGAFLEQTWCDVCQEVNLGMSQPVEYGFKGVVYIEGKCNRCHSVIVTELTDEEF